MDNYPKSLVSSIRSASGFAKKWFEKNAESFDKNIFIRKRVTKDKDNGEGCIYAFYRKNGTVIYVGQSGGKLKARTLFQTSKHRARPWWRSVSTIKLVNVANKAERLILEELLIIELMPTNNKLPTFKELKNMSL